MELGLYDGNEFRDDKDLGYKKISISSYTFEFKLLAEKRIKLNFNKNGLEKIEGVIYQTPISILNDDIYFFGLHLDTTKDKLK